MLARILEAVFRQEQARLMASLARVTRDLELAEEALQEALLRASQTWPTSGLPDNPGAWLNTVARRVAIELLRAQGRRVPLDDTIAETADATAPTPEPEPSEPLGLLFACCRSELPERAQTALALRVVLGLSTREIARAFLEDEPTTAQRLVRAKRTLRALSETFEVPPRAEWPRSSEAACRMIYLLFTEGYAATAGPSQVRTDLAEEAIRLGRLLLAALPSPRAEALLALMLLHAARTPARVDDAGGLVTLEDQDRTRWDQARIEEGLAALDRAIENSPRVQGPAQRPDPYVLQAAIAALHCRARTAAETDWPQIAGLYGGLLQVMRTPVVELNAAVSLAMAGKLDEGLRWLNELERRDVLGDHHVLALAKAELLLRAGHRKQAERYLRRARRLATNDGERGCIDRKLARLLAGEDRPPSA